jgi:hypothetical protein
MWWPSHVADTIKLIKITPPEVSASANFDEVHFVDIKVNDDSGVQAFSLLSRLVERGFQYPNATHINPNDIGFSIILYLNIS